MITPDPDEMKIEALTDEEWAAARAHWLRIGTCTEPADRPEAEAAFRSLYARAGFGIPHVQWCDGPDTASVPSTAEKMAVNLWDRLDDLRDGLESLRESLGDRPRARLFALEDSLWASLGVSQGNGLWSSIQRGRWTGKHWESHLEWGQENAYWVGPGVVFRDFAGVRYSNEQVAHLAEWERLVRSCGWWASFKGLVIACERPRVIRMDDRDVLHCEDGPAVECRDGHRVYAWHGTLVPAEWIEQRTSLDPAIALTWKDIEQRRCAAEIIGWHRVLELLDARTVDQDVDPLVGRLVEVDLPGAGLERFLVVRCGTGRTFALPVPPQMQTALEANAWTYGVEPELVRYMEVRT